MAKGSGNIDMSPNKYVDLNKTTITEIKPQHPSLAVTVQENVSAPPLGTQTRQESSASSVLSPTMQPAGGQSIPSKEHTARISALVIYFADKKSDAFVRIYDKVTVPRDEAFLVERKELIGKTPEDIQAHFSLTFLPHFICDASVPIGHQISMGKLTNAAGKRVSIYKALTALELSSERPLIPENIPPVRLQANALAAKAITNHQKELPEEPTEKNHSR